VRLYTYMHAQNINLYIHTTYVPKTYCACLPKSDPPYVNDPHTKPLLKNINDNCDESPLSEILLLLESLSESRHKCYQVINKLSN